ARSACRGMGKYQCEIPSILTARRRCRGRHWFRLSRVADVAAIDSPRSWRLSGDQTGSNRRHHYRQFDPRFTVACTGRTGDRELEGVRGVPPKPTTAVRSAPSHEPRTTSDGVAAAAPQPFG